MKRTFGIKWWLWLCTALTHGAHLGGWRFGLPLTIGLLLLQMAHQGWRARTVGTLPLQVRTFVLGIVLLGMWPPLRVLHALLLAGMTILIVFDYCLAGRFLSLMPWNRRGRLTVAQVRATFLAPRRPVCRFPLSYST